jgi:hypothetical protein
MPTRACCFTRFRNQNKTRYPVNHPATYRCYLTLIENMHGTWRMLQNGSYSVWFRTPLREGTGVVVINNGKITGGDTVLGYTGTYFQNGDKFTASVATRRHTPGQPSVFDIDTVDLSVIGTSALTTAACTGTARQAPNLAFEAVLVRIPD